MKKQFLKFIADNKLFGNQDKILLAVSGGIDSVVLSKLFFDCGFKFGIAHCNFGLRGIESDQDHDFVKQLALNYGVSFHDIKFDPGFKKNKNMSTQMWARESRYKWFENIRKDFEYQFIAVAHHQDDSIETFFINLIRGTGISGLTGIKAENNLVIRPLLFSTKKQIVQYSIKENLAYREDSSNATDHYIRNKIRHHLIPFLYEINPGISQTLQNEMKILSEMEIIYRKEINHQKSDILKKNENGSFNIDITKLKNLSPLPTYLFEFLKSFGFNQADVLDIISSLDSESGKKFISNSHILIKDREKLLIEKKEAKEDLFIEISNFDVIIRTPIFLKLNVQLPSEDILEKNNKEKAYLDLDKVVLPLVLRKWKAGDYFYPLGMRGKKKLSDFFIDLKLNLLEKQDIFVLESQGEICWIIGLRIDDRFKITAKTKQVLAVDSDFKKIKG